MILETDRLILRECNLDDVKYMVEGLSNYNTAINLTTPYPYKEEDAKSFVNKHSKHNEFDYTFAIVLKEENRFIGTTSLSKSSLNGDYSGGIWLDERYTGKGYGSEAFIARAKFAFEVLGLEEINNGYYYYNEKSANMQKKMGYEIVGEASHFCPALNKEVKEILTKLKKEKFYESIGEL